jgi:hypothetical protein
VCANDRDVGKTRAASDRGHNEMTKNAAGTRRAGRKSNSESILTGVER